MTDSIVKINPCFGYFSLQAYEEAQKRLKMAEDDQKNMVVEFSVCAA